MKNKQYLLGVDGGNTKTDYFLFDTEGNFVNAMRFGTCSHEALKDSFSGTKRVMSEHLSLLLDKCQITIDDIKVASFGLAGADTASQKQKLNEVLSSIGFKKFVLENDGMLGVKAGSTDGTGVCSINGTGTVTIGYDDDNHFLQVGGVGYISSDEAGGAFIVRRTFQACYDELYRMGDKTKITEALFQMYDIKKPEFYLDKIVELTDHRLIDRTTIIKMVFDLAEKGDKVAQSILMQTGRNMALSVAGCINHLHFKKTVQVILAGSVWSKASNKLQVQFFEEELKKNINIPYAITVLNETPACGAVLWAWELFFGTYPNEELKKHIKEQVVEAQKELPST